MKKKYVRPTVDVFAAKGTALMAGSGGVTGTGDVDIEYGGNDDGTHTPSAKRGFGYDVWEDDD